MSRLPGHNNAAAYAIFLFAGNRPQEGIAEFERVLQAHPDDIALRNRYSALLMTFGRRKDAERIVDGTLGRQSKEPGALLQQTALYVDAGNVEAAARNVQLLLSMDKTSPLLSYQQARIAGARGETANERAFLAQAVDQDANFLQARVDLARLLLAAGNATDASALLQEAPSPNQHTPEFLYMRTAILLATGDDRSARSAVDAELATGRNPAFLCQDAVLKDRSGDAAGAEQSLKEAFGKAPDNPEVLTLLGGVMKRRGQAERFQEMVKEAAAKNPEAAQLHRTLAALLAERGDVTGAIAAIRAAVASRPQSAQLRLELGRLLARNGESALAAVEFRAAGKAGDVGNSNLELAALHLQAGELQEARARLTEALKLTDTARGRMLMAEVEMRTGAAPTLLVQLYQKALQLEPENVAALNNLAGILAIREHKLDEALQAARKAAAVAPNDAAVLDTLGWVYYLRGEYAAALPYLERSLRIMKRPTAHYHLAAELKAYGDAERAAREYREGVKEDPKSDARVAAYALFEGLNK